MYQLFCYPMSYKLILPECHFHILEKNINFNHIKIKQIEFAGSIKMAGPCLVYFEIEYVII